MNKLRKLLPKNLLSPNTQRPSYSPHRSLTCRLACISLLTLFLFALPDFVHAQNINFSCQNAPSIVQSDGSTVDPAPSGLAPGMPYFGFSNRMVSCIEDVIFQLGIEIFPEIRLDIRNAVLAVLTLYLVLFGYKVAMGAVPPQRAGAEAILTILKVAVIAYFVLNTGLEEFFPLFYIAQGWLIDVVTASVGIDSSPCSAAYGSDLWARLDCTLAYFFGTDYAVGGAQDMASAAYNQAEASPWVFATLIAGLLFTSGAGLLLLFIAIICFIFIVAAIGSAIIGYVMALIALSVLFIIAPIIIPLFLFDQTRETFNIWFQAVLGYTLQPMVLFAFLAFMVEVLGVVIHGPQVQPGLQQAPIGVYPILREAHRIMTTTNQDPEPFINGQTALEENVDIQDDPQVDSKREDLKSWGIVLPNFVFVPGGQNPSFQGINIPPNQYHDFMVRLLIINLIVFTLVLALMMAFLFTAVELGGRLAGISLGSALSGRSNFVFKGAQKAVKVTVDAAKKAATSGG